MKSEIFFTKGFLIAFITRMHIMKKGICRAAGHLFPGSLSIKKHLMELLFHGIPLRDTLARYLSPYVTIPNIH